MNLVDKKLCAYTFFLFCLFYNLSFLDIKLKSFLRIMAFFIIFSYYLLSIIFEKKIYKKSYSEYSIVIIGLLLIIIIQFLYGKIEFISLIKYLDILILFFIVIIISNYISSKIGLYSLIRIINLSCFIPIIISFIIKPNNLDYSRDLFGDIRIRYIGLFAHPNHLGAMCLVGLITCLILIFKYKKKINYLYMLALIIPIYRSKSRTAISIFFIFCISIFVYRIFYKIKNIKIRVISKIVIYFFIISSLLILIMNFKINSFDLKYINKLFSGRVDSIIFLTKSNISPFIGQGPISNENIIVLFGKAIDSSIAIVYYQFGIYGIILFYGNLLRVGMLNFNNKLTNILIKSLIIIFSIYSILENVMTNLISIFGMYILIIIYCIYLDNIEKENCI